MRGKEYGNIVEISGSRITPAYAGKSAVQRGDITGMSGSPPPMRGKVRRNFPTKGDIGITPAYAGKS